MICYRDMTFCPYWSNCKKGKDCSRALTSDVIEKANKWWGDDNPPIMTFSEKPDCYEVRE